MTDARETATSRWHWHTLLRSLQTCSSRTGERVAATSRWQRQFTSHRLLRQTSWLYVLSHLNLGLSRPVLVPPFYAVIVFEPPRLVAVVCV